MVESFGFDPLDVPTNYRGLVDDFNFILVEKSLNTKANINELEKLLTLV